MSVKPWIKEGSKLLGDYKIFTLQSDAKRSPKTGLVHDFYVINTVDWVNVIALTPDNQLVMVEQYRHGSDTVELEIPGGMMDKEDLSPVVSGIRELREETGYEGHNARSIGQVYSNPAILNNTCHTILIEGCQLKHPVQFDECEDIVCRLVPVSDIPALIQKGLIRHSLVVVALYYFELNKRQPVS